MTWYDLKLFTLQKMFAVNGDTIIKDDTTNPYLLSMPAVANEALQLLSTAGRYIKKSVTIRQINSGDDTVYSEDVVRVLNGSYQPYNFRIITDDFYSFDTDDVYFLSPEGNYGKTTDFELESENILLLNGNQAGQWTVYYNAYPEEITRETEDTKELSLHPEVAAIIPLYMASQLYKDDDIGQAVQYRNEFEVARGILVENSLKQQGGKDSFVSETGWV